jgi:LPPG:FO 2-phospho-L-lactate transferase
VRTERMRRGEALSSVTADLATRLGLELRLLPATDDRLRTIVLTPAGELDFQTYFVARRHEDDVLGVRLDGAPGAQPAPGVLGAIRRADVVAIAPSNPYLSVDPILAVDGVRDALAARSGPVVAVSPIVGGRAVRGPADRIMRRLAGEATPAALGRHYRGVVTHMLVDDVDREHLPSVEALGISPGAAPTLMADAGARASLARAALALAAT